MSLALAASTVPLAGRIVPLIVLVALGVALAVVGWLGHRGRLAIGGRLGVRTVGALRSAEAFRLANRVAALPSLVAGLVAVVCGVAAFVMPDLVGTVLCTLIGLVGGLLIARAGGIAGDRAASALPVARPAACAGCACGVGGCAVSAQSAS